MDRVIFEKQRSRVKGTNRGMTHERHRPIPLAVRADTADPVELWLIRLRPAARPRYLATLRLFLDFGDQGVEEAIEAAKRDRHKMHEMLKSFVASLPDSWTEREFAYAAIRSFFSRCRIFLPTEPGYQVGGKKERWWL